MFCQCHDCKKARRKGLVLGTRIMGFWIVDYSNDPQYYHGPVSDYVPFHKFQKGRRPDQKFDKNNPTKDYE